MYSLIFTQASATIINRYSSILDRLMPEYGIDTPLRKAHFLAQLAVESGELRYTEEKLKYSYTRLMQVFPRYFRTTAAARAAAYNPEAIANVVYANRLGNGDTASGDGYRFRGRGLIQLTGRSNYTAFLHHLLSEVPHDRLDDKVRALATDRTLSDPTATLADMVSSPELAVRSACWFWKKNGLNTLADTGDTDAVVTAITRRVNGGTNGLASRKVYFYRAITIFRNRS